MDGTDSITSTADAEARAAYRFIPFLVPQLVQQAITNLMLCCRERQQLVDIKNSITCTLTPSSCSQEKVHSIEKIVSQAQIMKMTSIYPSSLTEAVKLKDQKLVENYLSLEYGNVDQRDNAGLTAAMWAVRCEDPRALKLILEHGSDVKAKDNEGNTVLMWAVRQGQPECLEHALHNWANPNTTDNSGTPALHYAVESELNLEILHILLHTVLWVNDLDINQVDSNDATALLRALKFNNFTAIKMLLQKGARVDVCNKEGDNIFTKAISEGCLQKILEISSDIQATELTSLLQEYGEIKVEDITTNEEEKLVVHYSFEYSLAEKEKFTWVLDPNEKYGQNVKEILEEHFISSPVNEQNRFSVLKVLLQLGINTELLDEDGYTPLINTCRHGHFECAQLLIEFSANVNYIAKDKMTPIYAAARNGHHEILALLLCKGAQVNSCPMFGFCNLSPLMATAKYGFLECASLLTQNTADISLPNDSGKTAIHFASEMGYREIVDHLLACGADADPPLVIDGVYAAYLKSPLMLASRNGYIECVKLLIQYHADVNCVNASGETALNLAAGHGRESILEVLLQSGAMQDIPALNGITVPPPITKAVAEGHKKCAELLMKAGCNVNAQNSDGDSSLHLAAGCSEDLVRLLCRNGANIHAVNGKQWSSAMMAVSKNKPSILKFLLENGVDVDVDDEKGSNAVHLAASKGLHDCLKILLSFGPKLNTVYCRSRRSMKVTPLMAAIQGKNDECVMMLLKHGFPATMPKSTGLKSTLRKFFTSDIVRLLHAAGTDAGCLPDLVCRTKSYRKGSRQAHFNTPTIETGVHNDRTVVDLADITRTQIRRHLILIQECNLFHSVPELPLPTILKSFLLFDEDLTAVD